MAKGVSPLPSPTHRTISSPERLVSSMPPAIRLWVSRAMVCDYD